MDTGFKNQNKYLYPDANNVYDDGHAYDGLDHRLYSSFFPKIFAYICLHIKLLLFLIKISIMGAIHRDITGRGKVAEGMVRDCRLMETWGSYGGGVSGFRR